MFSTVEAMPPDAREPFNKDICPLWTAVRAAGLDSVSGIREESNVVVPDDDVPSGGSQNGGGPRSGQTPQMSLEQQAFKEFLEHNTKDLVVPKATAIPMHLRVQLDENRARSEAEKPTTMHQSDPDSDTVSDSGEPPFARRRLKVIINVSVSLQPERKQNTKAKPKPRLDRHQSGQLPSLDQL